MKKRRPNIFYFLYQWLVFMPLFLVLTALTALTTIVGCRLGDDRKWGFYPPKVWARLTCWLALVRVKIVGQEYLNPRQSYILVCNHQSLFDIFAIYGRIKIPFKWIMKKELEKIPLVGAACRAAGHIYISRGQSKDALQSIEAAKQRLKNGLSVVIFPEGSRTFDGNVGAFKRGAFQMATDMELPIVPISIDGSYSVLPRTSYNITPHRITLTVHKPIPVAHTQAVHQSELMAQVKEIIENEIRK